MSGVWIASLFYQWIFHHSELAGGISHGRDEAKVRFDVDGSSDAISTPSFDEDALRRRTVKQLAAQLHGWLDGKIQHQKRGWWRLVLKKINHL